MTQWKNLKTTPSLPGRRSQSMRWAVFTGAILYWWQMRDWGPVTKLRCRGRGWGSGWKTAVFHNYLTPSPPPRNFVTGPQSLICHQYKMAPVNTAHRIDWDRRLRRPDHPIRPGSLYSPRFPQKIQGPQSAFSSVTSHPLGESGDMLPLGKFEVWFP